MGHLISQSILAFLPKFVTNVHLNMLLDISLGTIKTVTNFCCRLFTLIERSAAASIFYFFARSPLHSISSFFCFYYVCNFCTQSLQIWYKSRAKLVTRQAVWVLSQWLYFFSFCMILIWGFFWSRHLQGLIFLVIHNCFGSNLTGCTLPGFHYSNDTCLFW